MRTLPPLRPASATSRPVRRRRAPRALAWACALLLTLATPASQAVALPGPEVAWQQAGDPAQIDRAFAQARAEGKPLLLYWGASWCPPCNQLKATLFNRQDFIRRARGFVAVHVDGDLPGAQKLGARFKVSGYPTVLLFHRDGQELTRLPGEAEPDKVMALLDLGLAGGRPVKAVLADALAGRPLSANEWKLLGYYGWETDEAQLAPEADRPGLLVTLAAKAPASEAELGMRLLLKALGASKEGVGMKPDAATVARVRNLLAQPAAARAQADVLVNQADDIVGALAPEPGAARKALAAAFDEALERLRLDATLSRGDRVSALISQVRLARLDQPEDRSRPTLPAALAQRVREHTARDDREITDGHERQAVVTAGAHALSLAGLWRESDALLKANLGRSHSPYYLMSQLADNARKQGRHGESLDWRQRAFEASQGPATRLQWGAAYLGALVDLSPQDTGRIEAAAAAVLAEAAKDTAAFHERSARSLQRLAAKLQAWNRDGRHEASLQRLRQQWAPLCARVEAADGQRKACEALLRAG